MAILVSPLRGEKVQIQTSVQKEFLKKSNQTNKNDIDWLNLKNSGNEDRTFPKKVTLKWSATTEKSIVELSESADFENCRRYETNKNELEIENLLLGHKYFWRVNNSDVSFFTTEDIAPRWMRVDGLSNIRDIGGWKTESGKRIKQGLIYRGSEMNKHHNISRDGIEKIRSDIKIKTDLDIRGVEECGINKSPAGDDVEFCLIPCAAYKEFIFDEHKPTTKKLFETFANEQKYPIYFHCWGGADRTGTVAFLLGCVLDVPYEDLLTDYELTSLSIWGDRSRDSDLWQSLLTELDKYGNDTDSYKKKAINYLLSCGITEQTLNKIRENLL